MHARGAGQHQRRGQEAVADYGCSLSISADVFPEL